MSHKIALPTQSYKRSTSHSGIKIKHPRALLEGTYTKNGDRLTRGDGFTLRIVHHTVPGQYTKAFLVDGTTNKRVGNIYDQCRNGQSWAEFDDLIHRYRIDRTGDVFTFRVLRPKSSR